MSSDDQQYNVPDPLDMVKETHEVSVFVRLAFHQLIKDVVTAHPETIGTLRGLLRHDSTVIRVLHLISRGYSGTPTFYRATSNTDITEARLRGFVTFDADANTYILTEQGETKLRTWHDFMGPLKAHLAFAALWREVTSVTKAD